MSLVFKRCISNSPYGRTHVWKRRKPVFPNPVVPTFPQQVILADGSTFIHFTTSPLSSVKLTRDTTNNPLWNMNVASSANAGFEAGEEESMQFTRFKERFEGLQVTGNVARGRGKSSRIAKVVAEDVASKK